VKTLEYPIKNDDQTMIKLTKVEGISDDTILLILAIQDYFTGLAPSKFNKIKRIVKQELKNQASKSRRKMKAGKK
jgi:hypothetical protein